MDTTRKSRTRFIPLLAILVVLAGLNAGLYGLLAPEKPSETPETSYALPFSENFDDPLSTETWTLLGGDWEVQEAQLIQLNPLGYDLALTLPIEIPAEQPYAYDTQLQYMGGTMGGGIMFNLQQPTSRQQSHMVRCNVGEDALYVIWGYFNDASDFMGQGSTRLERLPEDNTPFRLGVQISPETYNITLDGQVIGADIPLEYRGGALGLTTSSSQVAFDNLQAAAWEPGTAVVVEPAAPEPTQPATIPEREANWQFQDDFEGTIEGEAPWQFFAGDWAFENGTLIQRQPTGFDLGAGYIEAFAQYRYTVEFQHQAGAGGGVLFNMPTPNQRNGAHMARYFEDGSVLAWGYYDDTGAFNGQGSALVPAAGDTPHTLEIISKTETFDIVLDGDTIATDIPLVSTAGHIGLTASESIVVFDSIALTSLQAAAPEPTAAPTSQPENVNTIEFSTPDGNWVIENGVINQLDTTLTDFVAGTGIAAEQFTVSVDILLPDPETHPDAGAGIIFHMAQRDDPANGSMTRFGSAGREIFWGNYDETGVFFGQGGSPLEATPETARNLALVVRQESFDILVDGESVVTDLPHNQSGGWIGLISYGGPITFTNFQLSLGEN